MDGHVARTLQGGPGRAADLPFPRALIELAFMKALREWPEGDRLESLKASYTSIDDRMLDDADYRVLVRGGTTREPGAPSRSIEAVRAALGEKARRRREIVEAIVAQRSRAYEPILHLLLILLGVWGLAWVGCLVAWGSVGFDGGLAGLLGGIVYQSGEAAGRFAGSLVSAGVVVFLLAPVFMVGAALAYLIFVFPFPSVRVGIVALWRRVSGIR